MIKRLPLPSQAALCAVLDYNPHTGKLVWRPGTQRAGKNAGYINGTGYVCVSVGGIKYLAHRIIWKIVHGIDPIEIDHQNGNKIDNSLINLRNCTHIQNQQNRALSKNNTSGVQGIHFKKSIQKWRARLKYNGKIIKEEYFTDFNDAVTVRKKWEIEFHFHPNHGREA